MVLHVGVRLNRPTLTMIQVVLATGFSIVLSVAVTVVATIQRNDRDSQLTDWSFSSQRQLSKL